MQNKRYQVFVSSTFTDLQDERRAVAETLLNLECIPAGMEWFGAIDEQQFEFIKKVIDDCDYYIVIIGGRYGTVTAEGVSYTEKEYDYAVSKGLKVLAFIHKDPGSIPAKHTEQEAEARAKLEKFKEKLKQGRLVEFWEGTDQLAGKVAVSMSKTIRMYPAVGWVRANQVATVENLAEVNELRKDNEQLKAQLASAAVPPKIEDLAGLEENVTVSGTAKRSDVSFSIGDIAFDWSVVVSWKELFAAIAPELIGHPSDGVANAIITKAMFAKSGEHGHSARIRNEDFQTIKIQLMALNLVNCHMQPVKGGGVALFWSLTDQGERMMLDARTVRTNAAVADRDQVRKRKRK
jgi:hypothetical protein